MEQESKESAVSNLAVQGNMCVGCLRFESDVMITLVDMQGQFNDWFLSTEQAVELMKRISRIVEYNTNEDPLVVKAAREKWQDL